MHLLYKQSNVFLHAAVALILSVGWIGTPLAAPPEQDAPVAPVISRTTLAEAREMWTTGNASIVGEGHLAIGGGNRVDGLSKVGLDQVLLVTVAGVDFEGLPVARYAFVDDVLYGISAQLRNVLSGGKTPFKELSDEELSTLEQALTKKYGKPRALKDPFAGKKPTISIWDLHDNELVLTQSVLSGYHLTLQNKALSKKVEAYKKKECKLHRQKGDTSTLVTAICL